MPLFKVLLLSSLGTSCSGNVLSGSLHAADVQPIMPVDEPWSGQHQVITGRKFSFIVSPYTTEVLASGLNEYGQLGVGSSDDGMLQKVLFPGDAANERIVSVAAGAFHSLFVTESGSAYAAGRNNWGQLGQASVENNTGDLVKVMDNVAAVSAGYGHSLFLMKDFTVRAAGLNSHGQLGDGSTENRYTPVTTDFSVDPSAQIGKLVAGYDFSLFLAIDQKLYGAGQNLGGQLGDGSGRNRLVPTFVRENVTGVSAGETHTMLLTSTGQAMGTGANYDGQIGGTDAQPKWSPQSVADGVSQVFAGGESSCFTKGPSGSSGPLFGLGSNRQGQLGLGEDVKFTTPSQLEAGTTFLSAALGESHSLFLTADQKVVATGTNANGELGVAGPQVKTPVDVYHVTTTATTTTITTTTITETTTTTWTGAEPSRNPLSALPTQVVIGVGSGVGVIFLLLIFCCCISNTNHDEVPEGEDLDTNEVELMRAELDV